MRALPEEMKARLQTGATSLCRCWRVERRDGVRLGFTDHDADLAFEGDVYRASSGLNASTLETSSGMSVDTQTIMGALQSDAISESDLDRGLFDGARVTMFLVDWTDPSSRLVISAGRIGEVKRNGRAFEAEVLSVSELLNQRFGRAFVPTCSLALGERKCGVDLFASTYRGVATVAGVDRGTSFTCSGLEGFADDWFTNGHLVWRTGANAGVEGAVRRHRAEGGAARVELWLSAPFTIAEGDSFEIVAGCSKTFEECRGKFSNGSNFRGFPDMPGDDWAAGYPEDGGAHDGGSLYRS